MRSILGITVTLGALAACAGCGDEGSNGGADAGLDGGADTDADADTDTDADTDVDTDTDTDTDADAGPPTVILPRESIAADELAVLVNTNDAQSIAVAEYYMAARGIPEANRVDLELPAGVDVATQAEFEAAKAVLDAALGPEIQALAITWTRPYRVECMSVTTAFALGFDTAYCSTPCSPTAAVDYFDSESLAPFTDHGIRPAMMLAAASVDEAEALVDRGLASDLTFPLGDGFLVRTTDEARSVRWGAFVQTVDAWDYDGGLALEYVDNSDGSGVDHIEGAADVLFYFTGLAAVPAIDTNTYRPGAVADHLTSYGGQVPTSGQMSAVAWLEAGATASYGTVVEPCNYTQKFPDTRVLLPRYFRGGTVVEAYWKSVHWPGEGLFVGEPLARPWGSTATFEDGALTIRTTALVPGRTYELSAAEDEAGPYTPVIEGITVPHLQITVVTLEGATAPFYELAETGG